MKEKLRRNEVVIKKEKINKQKSNGASLRGSGNHDEI